MSEKREFTRVHIRASLSLDLPDGTIGLAEVSDLSVSGLWACTALRPPVGAQGAFCLRFGDGEVEVRGTATVVRHGDGGFGVVFDAVDLEGYHHLTNLVTYNAEDRVEQVQGEIRAHLGLRRR